MNLKYDSVIMIHTFMNLEKKTYSISIKTKIMNR